MRAQHGFVVTVRVAGGLAGLRVGHGRRVRAVTVADIGGWVERDFEPVLDAFVENFDERGEVGAAVCIYRNGEPVVDLWGGAADATTGRPWVDDTVVLVYSSTKGVTSVCANLLVERGLLDPDATVASYWPEFAANGKAAITVRQLLSHQAGLPFVVGDFTLDEALSWDPIVARARRAGAGVAAGNAARLPHAHVRVARRRARAASRAGARSATFWRDESPRRSASTSGSGCPRRSSPASPGSCRRRRIWGSC